jgi:hypothetical protein
LRGVFSIDLEKAHPFSDGFVSEHISEGGPTDVIDRFGKVGFSQSGGVHIANGVLEGKPHCKRPWPLDRNQKEDPPKATPPSIRL